MNSEPKIDVLLTCYGALQTLDADAAKWVLWQLQSKLGGGKTTDVQFKPQAPDQTEPEDTGQQNGTSEASNDGFAEAFAKAKPTTNNDRVLFAAWFLFGRSEPKDFTGLQISRPLKHIGNAVKAVTVALGRLQETSPQLVVQIRKTGKSRQARKLYRITAAGQKAAKDMLTGSDEQ